MQTAELGKKITSKPANTVILLPVIDDLKEICNEKKISFIDEGDNTSHRKKYLHF
jgi:hypothetical protein